MVFNRCDVVVVGAGLAGLACAKTLAAAGLEVQIVEATDGVGGRVRTDHVEGFLLDRGFQIINTAYPELRRQANLSRLGLCSFDRAVRLQVAGRMVRLEDPRRHPSALSAAIRAPIGSIRDKAALAGYLAAVSTLPTALLLRSPDRAARDHWRRYGMSELVIDRLLRPFFAGLLLEEEMSTSSRFADLMMRMFIRGNAAVPAAGMQALPEQLAEGLNVSVHTAVSKVTAGRVDTDQGSIQARAVAVATDADGAAKLLPGLTVPRWKGVTTIYHSTDTGSSGTPALADASLVVDAEEPPITNTMVMTAAAPSYAPPGQALVATSIVHPPGSASQQLDEFAVRSRLARLHGTSTDSWQQVARYDVSRALPSMRAPHDFRRPVCRDGIYLCGDHRDTSSIQGALFSGRRTAEMMMASLGIKQEQSANR